MSERAPGRPLVAVAGRVIPAERIERALEPHCALPTYYIEALERAGAVGAVLAPRVAPDVEAAALMERFDGLVLTGGEDLDPAGYGEQPHPRTYGFDAAVDSWEAALYRAAVAAGRPVLAICRGHQLLNVLHGGSLDQHITDGRGSVAHGIPLGGGGADVDMAIEPGSRLAEALATTSGVVGRCHHHQAVGRLGDGLRAVATAPDGIVEGFEPSDGDGWVVAVQWHPEDSAGRDPVQQRLFAAFAVACATAREACATAREDGAGPDGLRSGVAGSR